VGQLLGGVLIAANPFDLGWRSIFLINLPVAAIVAPLAFVLLKENREGKAPKLDIGGVALLGATLTALIVPLIEGREQGWPLWSFVTMAAAIPLFLAFWRYEHRVVARGGDPLLVPSLLHEPGLRRGLAAVLFFNAISIFFLIFTIYEQAGNHQSPLAAGFSFLPLAIGFMISPTAMPALLRRFGHHTPSLALCLLAAASLAIAAAAFTGTHWAIAPAMFTFGLAQGVSLPSLIRTVLERVDGKWAGVSAGLVNTVMQISGALSVALIGGIFYTVQAGQNDTASITLAFAIATSTIGLALFISAWLIEGVRPMVRSGQAIPSATEFVAGH
jgi:MFS family permease